VTVVSKRSSPFAPSEGVSHPIGDDPGTESQLPSKKKKSKTVGLSFYSCTGGADELRTQRKFYMRTPSSTLRPADINDLQAGFREDRKKLDNLQGKIL